MPENLVDILRSTYAIDEEGNHLSNALDDTERARYKIHTHGYWSEVSDAGVNWQLVSAYISPMLTEDETELDDVRYALDKFVGQVKVLGAWHWNGLQFGTTLTRVENGVDIFDNQVRTVTVVQDGMKPDMEATIASGQLVEVPNMIEQVTYEPDGTTTEVPHYDELIEGTPMYPIVVADALPYMPDFIDANGVATPRTELTGINGICGQAPRRFN